MGLEGADKQVIKALASAVARQPIDGAAHQDHPASITWDRLVIMIARCTQVRCFAVQVWALL